MYFTWWLLPISQDMLAVRGRWAIVSQQWCSMWREGGSLICGQKGFVKFERQAHNAVSCVWLLIPNLSKQNMHSQSTVHVSCTLVTFQYRPSSSCFSFSTLIFHVKMMILHFSNSLHHLRIFWPHAFYELSLQCAILVVFHF